MSKLFIAAFAVLFIIFIAVQIWDFLVVDSCLDRGGRWNNILSLCEFSD